MYPYVYPHHLFDEALDPVRLVTTARNPSVAERIWRDNLRAYHGNRLGSPRHFVGDDTGIIYPLRNGEGLYPSGFGGPLAIDGLVGLGTGGLERVLRHYGLPVDRSILEEVVFGSRGRGVLCLTRVELLLGAVLEAVGARAGGADYGSGSGRANRDIETVAERAIERVFGDLLGIQVERDRGRAASGSAATALMAELVKIRLIQQLAKDTGPGCGRCGSRSRNRSRERKRDGCYNSEDDLQELCIKVLTRSFGQEYRGLGRGRGRGCERNQSQSRSRSRSRGRNCGCQQCCGGGCGGSGGGSYGSVQIQAKGGNGVVQVQTGGGGGGGNGIVATWGEDGR